MIQGRHVRLILLCAAHAVACDVRPQQPFDLDTTFRTEMDTWYVSSILPRTDGKVLVSGQMKFTGDAAFRSGALLNTNGSRDPTFPDVAYMGGKLTPWSDRIYQRNGHIVRRSWPDGTLDAGFITMNDDPLFSSLQGGDYHVYPDGRVLMSGVHILHDTVRGYLGPHCLVWFTNTGHLDTTRHHRTCSGSLDTFQQLPDGKFIGSGSTSTWDGQPASNIIRFHADGTLDPGFQASVWWGQAYGFLPLPDGRVYAGGNFLVTGDPDTLHMVRFLPDGSLDPTFNAHLDFRTIQLSSSVGAVVGRVFHQPDPAQVIVTGGFELVEGEPRQGICMIDTTGNLLDEHFNGPGCGDYTYQGFTYGGVEGIVPAPDGSYYIWGAYHGYDDGTTNDTLQRMVSRLHGLEVGIPENIGAGTPVSVYADASGEHIRFNGLKDGERARISVFDTRGVMVLVASDADPRAGLTIRGLPPGLYVIHIRTAGPAVHYIKWVRP